MAKLYLYVDGKRIAAVEDCKASTFNTTKHMAHDYDDKKQVLNAIIKLSKDGSWVSPLSISRALDISLMVAQKRLHWLNDDGELEVMVKNNTKFYRPNAKG